MDYIEYWDNQIKVWKECGLVPPEEKFWFEEQNLKLHANLIPEPYWGDIDCNSVVFVNLNPGAQEEEEVENECHRCKCNDESTPCGYLSTNYSEKVRLFPLLEENPIINYSAAEKWWKKRVTWLDHFGLESDRRPFAMELCAWHSKKWRGANYKKPAIHQYISEIFGPALERAIRGSEFRLALCVGSEFNLLIPEIWPDAQNITNDIITIKVEGNSRKFNVWSIPGVGHIISTSAQGSNGIPSKKLFAELEQEIMRKISD